MSASRSTDGPGSRVRTRCPRPVLASRSKPALKADAGSRAADPGGAEDGQAAVHSASPAAANALPPPSQSACGPDVARSDAVLGRWLAHSGSRCKRLQAGLRLGSPLAEASAAAPPSRTPTGVGAWSATSRVRVGLVGVAMPRHIVAGHGARCGPARVRRRPAGDLATGHARPSRRGGRAWASCRPPAGRTPRPRRAARRRGCRRRPACSSRTGRCRHHRGVTRVALQPLVRDLTAGAALDPDRVGPEEGEDLAALPRAHLDHRVVVLPGEVGPRAGLAQAVRLHRRDVHEDRTLARDIATPARFGKVRHP